MPVTSRWRTTKRDEFLKLGTHVIARCSFCDESYEGHRDKGAAWYRGHLYNKHRSVYFVQKRRPSQLKKKPKEKDDTQRVG